MESSISFLDVLSCLFVERVVWGVQGPDVAGDVQTSRKSTGMQTAELWPVRKAQSKGHVTIHIKEFAAGEFNK